MICKYAEIFCWKNVSSAKATPIFSAKNIRILYIESAKTVNEMILNKLVKLMTLWTTGPSSCIKWRSSYIYHVKKESSPLSPALISLYKSCILLILMKCCLSLQRKYKVRFKAKVQTKWLTSRQTAFYESINKPVTVGTRIVGKSSAFYKHP